MRAAIVLDGSRSRRRGASAAAPASSSVRPAVAPKAAAAALRHKRAAEESASVGKTRRRAAGEGAAPAAWKAAEPLAMPCTYPDLEASPVEDRRAAAPGDVASMQIIGRAARSLRLMVLPGETFAGPPRMLLQALQDSERPASPETARDTVREAMRDVRNCGCVTPWSGSSFPPNGPRGAESAGMEAERAQCDLAVGWNTAAR